MQKKYLVWFLMSVLLVSFVSAEAYDDFSGSSLDTTLWTETTSDGGTYDASWTAIDEYGIDTTNQNYHTAQLSADGSDRGIILSMTKEFSEGDSITYDVTSSYGGGNILSRVYINEQYLDRIVGTDSGGYATTGDIGYWNGDSEVGNIDGTYSVTVIFNSDGFDIEITNPNSNIWTYTVTSLSAPYTFGIATRTGDNGYGEFDYDNFEITETEETAKTTEEEVTTEELETLIENLEATVTDLQTTVEELQNTSEDHESRISYLENLTEFLKHKVIAIWNILKKQTI